MKTLIISLVGTAVAAVAVSSAAQQASSRIYRCGSTYTNSAAEAQAKGCKLMDGGNITVVEGTRVNGNAGVKLASAPQSVSTASQRVDADQQKARDSDAKAILEAELKKAEAKQAELAREYNNGEPERLGPENRNPQKYLDRVAELKASIARTDNDIAGLKRELARVAK